MNVCVCLFIIPSEVIFSASGHFNNTPDTQDKFGCTWDRPYRICLTLLQIRRTGLRLALPQIFRIVLNTKNNPSSHPLPPPPKKKDSWNRKFQTPKNPSIIPITLGVVLCLNSHPIHVFIATLHLYCSHNFIISAFESLGWDFYASYDENLNSLAFFKFSLSCCFCSVHNSHQQNKRTQKYIRVLENRLDKVTFRYISSG